MSKEVHITSGFNYDLSHLLGSAKFHDDAVKQIEELLSKGVIMDFAISFIGEPQDDGTYKNVELLGLSMIPRRNNGIQ